MTRTLIAGNWKMHGEPTQAVALAETLARAFPPTFERACVAVCPPATLLGAVRQALAHSAVALGGQDCHAEADGAYTGDISAQMLKEAGCLYVIVGHSERRAGHGETSVLVRRKAERAIETGLIPIVCVGESLAERESGNAVGAVCAQARESVPRQAEEKQFVLAYEPVWAIGTGKMPALRDIAQMHAALGACFSGARVLYGGSVKASNAAEIMSTEGVGGVLVGGASLKAEEFLAIVHSVSS